ncbi:MAG TPA: UTP--glucose-1-phosphate uridylyltransferase, partial [Spirochaetota bacterium]|nr:UTP--glucose-1-phosphate uridylyltransferase [Spirochaetota bacterium]
MIQGRNAYEKKLIGLMEQNGQFHLLRFWDELNDAGKDLLIGDLKKIDFKLFKRFLDIEDEVASKNRDVSLPPVIEIPKSSAQKKREKEAFEVGCRLIGESKLAVFTAAGGQSSRLGLDYPKGAYGVTPIKKKPLFQVYAEKIRYMQDRFGVGIPWIIMVSETNREQTREFFESNGFFGLKIDRVRFVEQGGFPAYDPSGKIFL